ncbi:hypothetical protein NPIL_158931, partial [Nephila pilipes]
DVDEEKNNNTSDGFLHILYDTVAREDIFNDFLKIIVDYNLDWVNLNCLTVDGGKNTGG